MSFSGTPLGQGRRLDHQTFLGKPPSNGIVPPPSYAYGAPALGSRSPPKPTSPTRTRTAVHDLEEGQGEENEPALLRFAKLKQRESAGDFSSRPGGPKTQTSPLKPEKWAYKDTTVNIANAFVQAANGADMSATYNNPHNTSWASSSSREKAHLPRHTSADFEENAAQASKKRLAAPPDKLGRAPTSTTRKPPSKSTSLLHVPDSEGEGDARGLNSRAKSPLEHGITFAKNALGAAAFYVRQRSREPEDHSSEQPTANGATNGNDSSYDYAAEEQAFQAQKRNNATHKRNRMSVDNKAYKPSQSDDEESEYSDDGKTKRRRKKSKKGPLGGPLTTLPVVGSDKRRRRKGHGSKGHIGGPDEDDSESDENTQMDIQSQSAQQQPSVTRTSNPPLSRASASRFSQEPPEHDPDDSMMSANQGLDSIPEIEETLLPTEPVRQSSQQRRARSRTPAPQPSSSSFSVGGLLGSIVHVIIKLSLWLFSGLLSVLSMFTFLFGQVFGTTFDIILRRPVGWARSAGPLLKYLMPALTLLFAWYILQSASLGSYVPSLTFPQRSPVYQAPVAPPADIAELADRLLRIENAISGLSLDTERTKAKTEDGIKGYSDLLGRLGHLEGRLSEETRKVKDAEAKAREVVSRSISSVKQEVEVLQSQLIAQQKQHEKDQRTPTDITDTDARVKLKALEERVGGVEGGVKEALELGKKAVTAVPPPAAAPVPGAAWWNKLTSSSGSRSVLQIKSADGQDVSALITHMVDSAVSRINKDGIAKADYALHSGGARVIPKLTSDVLEIKPRGLGNQLVSLVTGNGGYIAHPPVMALHPDLHSGRCWPFAGDRGTLGVALAAPISVEEITVDHIATEVAFDMRSAPREMEVWGMLEGQDNVDRVQAWRAERAARKEATGQQGTEADEEVAYPVELPKHPEFIRLANFTYDIHVPSNVQTFPVDPEVKDLGVDFGVVVLRVLSNWGRDEYTCLYRFRVHGQRIGEVGGPLFGDGSS